MKGTVYILAEQIEALLADLPTPQAQWVDGKVSQDGYRVMIAGGDCVEVDYVNDPHNPRHQKVVLDLIAHTLRQQFDKPWRLGENAWDIRVDVQEQGAGWHVVHARLHWIS